MPLKTGMFVDDVFSLFFSLCLSVAVFLCLAARYDLDPYTSLFSYTKAFAQPLVLFVDDRVRWLFLAPWLVPLCGLGSGWSVLGLGFLAGRCFGRWVRLVSALHCCSLASCIFSCSRTTAIPVDRPQWRPTPSRVTRLLLGVDLGRFDHSGWGGGGGGGRHCD